MKFLVGFLFAVLFLFSCNNQYIEIGDPEENRKKCESEMLQIGAALSLTATSSTTLVYAAILQQSLSASVQSKEDCANAKNQYTTLLLLLRR